MNADLELILDAKTSLGEGALWHAQKQVLYWVDIEGKTVRVFDPAKNSHQTYDLPEKVGTVVPRAKGGLMLALEHGLASYEPSTGALKVLADPESSLPNNRFNDGKCDPQGRFWAGTISQRRRDGSLYCLHADLKVERKIEGIGVSNGIVWSLDQKTMFYIDTAKHNVEAYDYDAPTARISNRRVAIEIGKEFGAPDGMTLDAEGMLWIAHWEGASVRRWDPRTAKLLQTVEIPAARVTSCAFGGPNLDQLYVTTARIGSTPEEDQRFPHAGGLFRLNHPGVKGIPAPEFAG